jgi:hypothetical protein
MERAGAQRSLPGMATKPGRSRDGVLLFNVLFRMGLADESDRDREKAARRYFDEHGQWPDEA